MVATKILAARGQKAEEETISILADMGFDEEAIAGNRNTNPARHPVEFAARQSQLLLSLAQTVAEQEKKIAELEKALAVAQKSKTTKQKKEAKA